MKLSVIIVSYQVRHYLSLCLDSLKRALQGVEAEVIVVDNHSGDDTVDYLRKNYSWVRLIANNHNLGFARANNIAIRQAKGEFVLLLNPDTVVAETTIVECLQFMENHTDAGALGVCMLNRDGTFAKESRRSVPTPMTAFYKMSGLCSLYPESRRYGRYYMGWLPWDRPASIQITSGAFSMFRLSKLQEMRGFDEDYFMYGEDIDLSYRLMLDGCTNYYLPATILHYKGESTHKSSFRYVHVFYEAMLIFLKKHFGNLSILLALPVKIAIYVKALGALMSMSLHSLRKMLGFPISRKQLAVGYVCVGSQQMLDCCRKKLDERALDGLYIKGDGSTLPKGHTGIMEQIISEYGSKEVVVVYDTNTYTYQQVLSIFAGDPHSNITIAFYCENSDVIVTGNEVIQ